MRSPVSGRLATAATATLLGATALTGCGLAGADEPRAASDVSPVAAASQSVDPDEVAALVRDGVDSLTTAGVEVSASGGMVAGSAAGVLDLTGDTPAMSLVTDDSDGMGAMLGGPAEIRVVDGKAFVKVPVVTGQKFADVDDLLGQVGPLLGDLGLPKQPGGGQLPDSVREGLQDLDLPALAEKAVSQATEAQLVGTESIDGVDTDHYTLTVEHDGQEQAIDTYLDDDGVPLRSEADTPMGTLRVDLTDLGEPVDITAPAASEVTSINLDKLLGDLGVLGGLGGFQGFGGTTEG